MSDLSKLTDEQANALIELMKKSQERHERLEAGTCPVCGEAFSFGDRDKKWDFNRYIHNRRADNHVCWTRGLKQGRANGSREAYSQAGFFDNPVLGDET